MRSIAAKKTMVRMFAGAAAAAAVAGTGAASATAAATATAATAATAMAPACKGTDLYTTLGPVHGGAGQRYSTLDFTTLGGVTCVLVSGQMTDFQFLGDRARPLPTNGQWTGDRTAEVTIAPGDVAHLDIRWSVVGGSRFTPVSLMFRFPADDASNAAAWTGGPVGDNGTVKIGELHL